MFFPPFTWKKNSSENKKARHLGANRNEHLYSLFFLVLHLLSYAFSFLSFYSFFGLPFGGEKVEEKIME